MSHTDRRCGVVAGFTNVKGTCLKSRWLAFMILAIGGILLSGCSGWVPYAGNRPMGPDPDRNRRIMESESKRYETTVRKQMEYNKRMRLPPNHNIGIPIIGYGEY